MSYGINRQSIRRLFIADFQIAFVPIRPGIVQYDSNELSDHPSIHPCSRFLLFYSEEVSLYLNFFDWYNTLPEAGMQKCLFYPFYRRSDPSIQKVHLDRKSVVYGKRVSVCVRSGVE